MRSSRALAPLPLAVGVLALALMVAFPDVVLHGRTLTTAAFSDAVTGEGAPTGYPGPAPLPNPFVLDPLASSVVSEPAAVQAGRLLRAGTAPLWNPALGLGQPLLASAEPQFVSPLRLPLAVWHGPVAWDVFLLARLLLAGVATLLLARRLGLGTVGGTVAGAAYMLNGYHHVHVNDVHVDYTALVPVLLLAVEAAVARPRAMTGAGVALATALVTLADNPQAAVVGLGFGASYGLARVLARRGDGVRSWRRLAVLAAGGCLGIGLTAVVLLPFLQLSGAVGFPGLAVHGHEPGDLVGLARLRPRALATLVLPWLYGAPGLPFARDLGLDLSNYVGLVVPLLALLALPARGALRRHGAFLTVVVVLCLAKVYGPPALQGIGRLPLLSVVNFVRYLPPVLDLSLALLAGTGVAEVVAGRVGRRRVALAGLVAAAAVAGLLAWNAPVLPLLPGGALPLVVGVPAVLAGLAVAGLLAGTRAVDGRLLGGLAVLLVVGEAVALGLPARGTQPATAVLETGREAPTGRPLRHDAFEAPPFVEWLDPSTGERGGRPANPSTAEAAGRVVGEHTVLAPNTAVAFGLDDVRTQSALTVERYQRLVEGWLSPRSQQRFTGFAWSPFDTDRAEPGPGGNGAVTAASKEAMLDLLAVEHVVAPMIPPDHPRRRAAREQGYVRISPSLVGEQVLVYRNLGALPRAFVVGDAVGADDAEDALRHMRRVLSDPGRLAVVEGLDPELAERLDDPRRGADRVELVRHEPNRVALTADLAAPGLLVLSDTWYPGWTATVDGEPAEVLPTDVALRGVYLDAGEHDVVLAFAPKTVRAGAAVSVVSAGLVGLWTVVGALHRRLRARRSRTEDPVLPAETASTTG